MTDEARKIADVLSEAQRKLLSTLPATSAPAGAFVALYTQGLVFLTDDDELFATPLGLAVRSILQEQNNAG